MDKFESLLDRLEKVAQHLETNKMNGRSSSPSTAKSDGSNIPVLQDYDRIITGPVNDLINASTQIDGDVKEICQMLLTCFLKQKQFLEMTVSRSKPDLQEFESLVLKYNQPIQAIVNFHQQKRGSPYFDHLTAVADSVLAMNWIGLPSQFHEHIRGAYDSAEYYVNRILKKYNKDSVHTAWTKALLSVWNRLDEHVVKNHPAGLKWNAMASNAAQGQLNTGVCAPQPPPTPPKPVNLGSASTVQASGTYGALFADLNRGEAITTGLRKVTDDMKTHKNPALKTDGRIQPTMKTNTSPKKSSENTTSQKTAMMQLQEKRWIVKNFEKQHLHITETKTEQTVYIFQCVDCIVEVKGKVNSIVLDSCKKTGLIFDHLIASLDIVNCQSVQAQSKGQLFIVSVEKTDGCQLYLSPESIKAEIVTSKVSEINVLVPNEEGAFEEYAIPVQLKSVYSGKGLKTTVLDIG